MVEVIWNSGSSSKGTASWIKGEVGEEGMEGERYRRKADWLAGGRRTEGLPATGVRAS